MHSGSAIMATFFIGSIFFQCMIPAVLHGEALEIEIGWLACNLRAVISRVHCGSEYWGRLEVGTFESLWAQMYSFVWALKRL